MTRLSLADLRAIRRALEIALRHESAFGNFYASMIRAQRKVTHRIDDAGGRDVKKKRTAKQ